MGNAAAFLRRRLVGRGAPEPFAAAWAAFVSRLLDPLPHRRPDLLLAAGDLPAAAAAAPLPLPAASAPLFPAATAPPKAGGKRTGKGHHGDVSSSSQASSHALLAAALAGEAAAWEWEPLRLPPLSPQAEAHAAACAAALCKAPLHRAAGGCDGFGEAVPTAFVLLATKLPDPPGGREVIAVNLADRWHALRPPPS